MGHNNPWHKVTVQWLNISPVAKYLLTWDINALGDAGVWVYGRKGKTVLSKTAEWAAYC